MKIHLSLQLFFKRNYLLIKKINCAQSHSLLLSSDENIHSLGLNGIESTYATSQLKKKLSFYTKKLLKIVSHYNNFISITLTVNGIYYAWGECEKKEIREPKETEFKSFDEIFAKYFEITHKSLNLSENESRNEKSVLMNIVEKFSENYSIK
jgi:alpha-tubulin suppressor-like RCC1 family protein